MYKVVDNRLCTVNLEFFVFLVNGSYKINLMKAHVRTINVNTVQGHSYQNNFNTKMSY